MNERPRQTGPHVHDGADAGDVRARADALLRQMTPAEKAGQLTQYFYFRLAAWPRRRRRVFPARMPREMPCHG